MPAAPSAPTLGPLWDGVLTGLGWITLMGFVGVLVLFLLAVPVARGLGAHAQVRVSARLARLALALGVLTLPACFLDLAHGLSDSGGYDLGGAWQSLYAGGFEGVLTGLEYTLVVAAALLVVLPALRPELAVGRLLVTLALPLAALGLLTTKFPSKEPTVWGRSIFETLMWALHLWGGGIWVGGLLGLVALALPGALPIERRGRFWSRTIRRFSAAAMGCVAAITLSGIWLYWEHVDGPSQLFTTLYGRTLLVKIIIFGTMTGLGAVNQFWLHPRIDRLRGTGDDRPLLVLLTREFPAVIALETLLGMAVLMVAPFLHGSARNQAYQADHPPVDGVVQKLATKTVSGTTWAYGAGETVLVAGVMAGGYVWSGRIARRRTAASA